MFNLKGPQGQKPSTTCGPRTTVDKRWLSQYSDSLWAGRFEKRILVAARFSALVLTGPESHPAP